MDLIHLYLSHLYSRGINAPGEQDFSRACLLVAYCCLQNTSSPKAISRSYVESVLDRDGQSSSYLSCQNKKLGGEQIVSKLVSAGVVHEEWVRFQPHIDCSYHPVAEYLAASYVNEMEAGTKEDTITSIKGQPDA